MIVALLVVLFALALAGLPLWPYAAAWEVGYGPSGVLGLIFAVMLLLTLTNGLLLRPRSSSV